jgi:murein DD-endopeptidase MepM/ murein hydrolase activator NlpD
MDQAIRLPGDGSSWAQRLEDVSHALSRADWTPDLGTNIGSPQWFRGLVSCAALCTATVMMAPGIRPLHVMPDAPLDGRAWDEARAQSIAPLAWGADSGKRMAANDLVAPLESSPERAVVSLNATLGQGDSFTRVLERAGVSAEEARHVTNLVAGVADVNAIEPGTVMPIVLGARPGRNMPRPLQSIQLRASFDLKVAITRGGNGLQITRTAIPVNTAPLRIRGFVGASLYRSARAAGVPAKAIEAYLRAISDKVEFDRDLNGNAVFDIIVENARAATGETRAGKLLYAGLESNSRKLHLLEWSVGGQKLWFDGSGLGRQSAAGVIEPVAASRISSGFGMRFHPIMGYSRFHKGVDYAAVYGTPIRAVRDGVVFHSGRSGGYGNQVRINHGGNVVTTSSHMSRLAVYAGQRVVQGQVIGYVGSTGLSTGPHLHFEVLINGTPVNPRAVKFATATVIDGREREAFRAKLAGMLDVPVAGGT